MALALVGDHHQLGDRLAEPEELLHLADAKEDGAPVEIRRGGPKQAAHPERLAGHLSVHVLHREHHLVSEAHVEPARELLAQQELPALAVQVVARDDGIGQDRDPRLAGRIDPDHLYPHVGPGREHQALAPDPGRPRLESGQSGQRIAPKPLPLLDADLETGLAVESRSVDLEVTELGGDGRLDHLEDHAVVHCHGEQDPGESHRDGGHHDAGPPRASPDVPPRHSPHHRAHLRGSAARPPGDPGWP
jgi:hypothetical protein